MEKGEAQVGRVQESPYGESNAEEQEGPYRENKPELQHNGCRERKIIAKGQEKSMGTYNCENFEGGRFLV